VHDELLEALKRYRRYLNLTELPEVDETEPLIRSLRSNKSIGARRINQVFKELFAAAAVKLEAQNPEEAEHLRKGSPHWLRHSSITYQGYSGVSKKHQQDNAGHAHAATTEIYDHSEEQLRHDLLEPKL